MHIRRTTRNMLKSGWPTYLSVRTDLSLFCMYVQLKNAFVVISHAAAYRLMETHIVFRGQVSASKPC